MELRSRLSDRQCRIYSAVAVAVLGVTSLGTAVAQSSEPTTPTAESAPLGEVPVEHSPAEEFSASPGLEGVDLLAPPQQQASPMGAMMPGAAVPGAAMLPSAPGPSAGLDPTPFSFPAAPQGPRVPAVPAQQPAAAPLAPPPAQLPAGPAAAPAAPAPAPGFGQAPPAGGVQQAPVDQFGQPAAPGTAPAAPAQTTAPEPGLLGDDQSGTQPEPPRRTGGAVGLLGLN